MTHEDFRNWLRYHQSKFTGLREWIAKLPAAESERSPSRSEVMDAWFRTLRNHDLELAKQATDLLGDDDHPEPRGYDRHPLAVASICKRLRSRGRSSQCTARHSGPRRHPDGTETFVCPTCHDWGLVQIYHPSTVEAFREGQFDGSARGVKRYTAAARCTCNDEHHRDLAQYDPHKHVLAGASPFSDEGLEALASFCSIERRMADAEWTPSPLPIS